VLLSFFSSLINCFRPHSACYSSLKQWQKALEDALQSISKDPKFIKAYYRLSSAQTELQLYNDAEATLKAALSIEPGWFAASFLLLDRNLIADNEVIIRQLKSLNAKRNSAAQGNKKNKSTKKLDEAQVKEVQ
jgi:tetratricopeptide (TPR) repeat protein